MFRLCHLLILLLASFVAVGCGDVYRNNDVFVLLDANAGKEIHEAYVPLSLGKYQYMDPYKYEGKYKKATEGNDLEARKNARNELLGQMLAISDLDTAGHLSRATGTQINANVFLGSANLALTGAAAVASGGTSQAFAAAATGLGGFRELFNNQVYRDALIQSLVSLIIADRRARRAELQLKQGQPIDQYSVEEAIGDAYDYHARGSFYYGLTLVRQAADEKAKEKTQPLDEKSKSVLNQAASTQKAAESRAKANEYQEKANEIEAQRRLMNLNSTPR